MNSIGAPVDDQTSTPIDQLLQEVNKPNLPINQMSQAPPVVMSGTSGGTPWVHNLAKQIMTLLMIFISTLLVSLPVFQDFVLSYIPKAINASGCLTVSGAFFKAIIAVAIFLGVQSLFTR